MSEDELRKALLQRESTVAPEEELKLLRDLIQSEQRRVSSLGRWTLVTWTGWGMCLALMLIMPHWLARPAGAAAQPGLLPEALFNFAMHALAIVIGVGAIVLPIAGVVLLILYIVASRSAMSRKWFAIRAGNVR